LRNNCKEAFYSCVVKFPFVTWS